MYYDPVYQSYSDVKVSTIEDLWYTNDVFILLDAGKIKGVHENTRMYFCVSGGTTKMSEVLKAYAQEKLVPWTNESTNRYLFQGQHFGEDDTPNILEMEDGDFIDYFAH